VQSMLKARKRRGQATEDAANLVLDKSLFDQDKSNNPKA